MISGERSEIALKKWAPGSLNIYESVENSPSLARTIYFLASATSDFMIRHNSWIRRVCMPYPPTTPPSSSLWNSSCMRITEFVRNTSQKIFPLCIIFPGQLVRSAKVRCRMSAHIFSDNSVTAFTCRIVVIYCLETSQSVASISDDYLSVRYWREKSAFQRHLARRECTVCAGRWG